MLDFTEMPPGSFLGADGVVRSWLQPIWWSPGALLKVRANPKFLKIVSQTVDSMLEASNFLAVKRTLLTIPYPSNRRVGGK